jgi:ferredoxin
MPASKIEIEEAREEHIEVHPRKGPSKIIGKEGKVVGFETVDCVSIFDEKAKFNPKFAPGSESLMEADTVIMAIGQSSDLSWIHPGDGIEVTPRNTIKTDPTTLATTAPGVYAGGDVSFGPRNAIDAVANGKKAAQSIHRFLSQKDEQAPEVHFHAKEVDIVVHDTRQYLRKWGYEKEDRVQIPTLPIDRRIGVSQVELGYTEEQARCEASRCLHCWVNTIFNPAGEDTGTECILCGGCVDICPEYCIDLVTIDRVDADAAMIEEMEKEYDVVLHGETEAAIGSVMIKDEDRCIRCGLCAMRCPVGCITMESYTVSETMPV